MQYYEISAKSGENINEMFKSMAIMLQPSETNQNNTAGNLGF